MLLLLLLLLLLPLLLLPLLLLLLLLPGAHLSLQRPISAPRLTATEPFGGPDAHLQHQAPI